MNLFPMGDSAIVVELASDINPVVHRQIQSLCSYLEAHPHPWVKEFVPAFTTVTIFYDPLQKTYAQVEESLRDVVRHAANGETGAGKTVNIPVCYGGSFGPDIEDVARINGLSVDEVISIHTSGEYLVYMIGFAPGFPYLGGLSDSIATPRRSSPRLVIPAGSVGIAGSQTGVYPIETPGGWQLIGKTPFALFRPLENPPSLLSAGDTVRFYAISEDEYAELSASDVLVSDRVKGAMKR